MKYLKTFEVSVADSIKKRYVLDGVQIIEFKDGTHYFKIKSRRYSIILGAGLLLGTKIENNKRVRNIKLVTKPKGPALNNNSTKKSMSKIFLSLLGFDENYIEYNYVDFSYKITFREIIDKAETIGDIFDGLRELLEQYKFENEISKYNI